MDRVPEQPGHGNVVNVSAPGSFVVNVPAEQHIAQTSLPLPSQYGQLRRDLSLSYVRENAASTKERGEKGRGGGGEARRGEGRGGEERLRGEKMRTCLTVIRRHPSRFAYHP